jgi:hypothetical protein
MPVVFLISATPPISWFTVSMVMFLRSLSGAWFSDIPLFAFLVSHYFLTLYNPKVSEYKI